MQLQDPDAADLFIAFSEFSGSVGLTELSSRLHTLNTDLWPDASRAKTWLWRLQGGCTDARRAGWLRTHVRVEGGAGALSVLGLADS